MKTGVIAALALALPAVALGGECATRLEPLLNQDKPTNVAPVFDLCKREADKGDAESLYFTSFFYFGFGGLEQNAGKGVAATRAAAEKGYADAQFWMGWQHEIGVHLPKDAALSMTWYQKAAATGHGWAIDRLVRAYEKGDLGVAVDLAKAKQYASLPRHRQ